MKFDIAIVTFKERFNLFKNLIESIRKYNTTSNIIVSVNGEINNEFDESYRVQLYDFLKQYPNIYLRIWPEFRGLSKLINDCIIASTTEYILYMSDDSIVTSNEFFNDVVEGINKYQGMFRISSSGSFIVFNIQQMHKLGYYDERFLAIGKEDADMFIRYKWMYHTDIPMHESTHITNLEQIHITQSNFEKEGPNYPKLNLLLLEKKINEGWEDYQQYPYEQFYRLNKTQIIKYTDIKYEF
jgi:hypothetical protein